MKRLRNVLWVHGEQGHRPGGRKPRPETQTRSEGRRAGGRGREDRGVQSQKGRALGVGGGLRHRDAGCRVPCDFLARHQWH